MACVRAASQIVRFMSDEYELFLQPRLRLFLSADIVGSTAHKQNVVLLSDDHAKSAGPEFHNLKKFEALTPPWLSPITKFYREIDRIFSQKWKEYCDHTAASIKWPPGESPELWKGVGDEIIYTKVITDHRQAFACVHIWSDTVRSYRILLRTEYKSLDIKATAWLAGFPIANSEVIIKNQVGIVDPFDTGDDVFYNFLLLERHYSGSDQDKRGLTRDFVGPSIDTGFRISALSTPRKFNITIDLALLLVSVTPPVKFFEPLYVRYEGRQALKGVLGGRPYPIFWVDLLYDDKVLSAEDKLRGSTGHSEEDIRQFCEKFLTEHEEYMIRPFIYKNADPHFGIIPDIYENHLRKLSADWPLAKHHKEIEIGAIGGEEGPAPEGAVIGAADAVKDFQVPETAPPAPRERPVKWFPTRRRSPQGETPT